MFPFTKQNSYEDDPGKYHTNTNRKLPKVPEFQKAEESDYNIIYEEMENMSETYMDMDGMKSKECKSVGTYEMVGKY